MSRHVLLVGGGNQVSAFLIPALLKAGHRLTVHSRGPCPPWLPAHPLLDWDSGPWHQAHHRSAQADSLIYLAPLGQFSLLWRGLAHISRVIAFSSTSRVSKELSEDPAERAVATELGAGERDIRALTDASGAALTVLRPTLIYGAGMDRNLTRLAAFIQRWRVMPLLGQGCGRRQPVHAADLAQAAVNLLQREAALSGTYDLPGGSTLSYRSMVQRVFESLHLMPRFVSVPSPAVRLALPLLNRTGRWRDLNLAMLNRMNNHLEYDLLPAQRDFHYQPRPFRPTASTWLPPDQQQGL